VNVFGAWGFIAAGTIARGRAATARTGSLMLAVGFGWLLFALRWSDGPPLVQTAAVLSGWWWAALFVHLVVTFPSGRITTMFDRVVVVAAYTIAAVQQFAFVALTSAQKFHTDGCARCPAPLVALRLDPDLGQRILHICEAAGGVVALALCAALIQHWRRATPPQRRLLTPLMFVTVAAAVMVATSAGVAAIGHGHGLLSHVLDWLWDACVILFPLAFLGGLLHARMARAVGVSRLVDQLDALPGPDRLVDALAQALGDPSLSVVYCLAGADGYVDAEGQPVALDHGPHRAVTPVEVDGRVVAALLHDSALEEDAALVRAASRAAGLWLERTSADAERRARIAELRESRGRIVHAGDAERRRIERDLHDGAQQRLASLLLHTKLERRALNPIQDDAQALLGRVERGLAEAMTELRALAAGILPPELSDHGLRAAIDALAESTPIPVIAESIPSERLPATIETAAYFFIAEALTNAIKHAHASHVVVRIERLNRRVTVCVKDDGVGGADHGGGTGLRGLADRIGALDGSFTYSSPYGGGTELRADIPLIPVSETPPDAAPTTR
jgi:signal transduction histidine kinase